MTDLKPISRSCGRMAKRQGCEGAGFMKATKRARLEAHGWRVGSAAEFLELTPEESAFVDTKLALSRCLRSLRTSQNVSQAVLAKRLKSSQSRVAKMEAADATVSID